MTWIKVEDAPLEQLGFVWSPEKAWDNRTDVTGTVHEYEKDREKHRIVSAPAHGWNFTHWHPLLKPPVLTSTETRAKNMSERPIEELVAGNSFRETLIPRADDKANLMWHGWAIMDGFLAGIDYARHWRPIASARKDGSFMWLSDGWGMRIGYWFVVTKDPSQEHWADFAKAEAGGPSDLPFDPTLWLPLPKPPATSRNLPHC